MKVKHRVLLGVLILLAVSAGAALSAEKCETKGAVTPAWGSAERKAILQPLRTFLRENMQVEAVFVVRWMKVNDNWAWVETDPQSKDGKEKYEPLLALLKREKEGWTIAEMPPLEEDSPPVDDLYFRGLVEAHPGLSSAIFPSRPKAGE